MISRQQIILTWLLLLPWQLTVAQPQSITPKLVKLVPEINAVVQQLGTAFIQQRGRVGLSIGILQNGKTYFYNFGSTQLGKNRKPTQQTIYEIGSITKTFTSFLLAQAVTEGKVKLDDDIRTYMAGNYGNLSYEGKPIRLVHLANYTSGLPDNLPDVSNVLQQANPDSVPFTLIKHIGPYTKQAFLADLHQAKLSREPGLYPQHSNVAAQLLGYILEQVYQTSYEKLIATYIEKPLAMNHTAFPESKWVATGYSEKGISMPLLTIPTAQASGGLRYTAADMLKYIAFQMNEANKAVALSHQATWGSVDEQDFGLGWNLNKTIDSKRRLRQSGGTFGFASSCDMYPDQQLGLILLANESDQSTQDELQQISYKLVDALYGTPPALQALQASLAKQDYKDAFAIVNQVKQQHPELHLTEDYVNSWGYTLIGEGKIKQALELFKLNVQLYPNNFNTYDSLAETYDRLGNRELAIQNYKRTLELNPGSTHAMEELKKIEATPAN